MRLISCRGLAKDKLCPYDYFMASGLLSSEAVFYTRLRAVRHSDPTYLQEVKSNMPTQAKRENIDMLCEALKKSDAVIIVEYRGLTVKKISEVRRLIRKAGGEMKVSKNTLMRIALQECGRRRRSREGCARLCEGEGQRSPRRQGRHPRRTAGSQPAAGLRSRGSSLEGPAYRPGRRNDRGSASRTRHGPFRPAEKPRHCPFSDQGQEGGDRRVVCAERFSRFPREREREAA